jgi:hypothetical protein
MAALASSVLWLDKLAACNFAQGRRLCDITNERLSLETYLQKRLFLFCNSRRASIVITAHKLASRTKIAALPFHFSRERWLALPTWTLPSSFRQHYSD